MIVYVADSFDIGLFVEVRGFFVACPADFVRNISGIPFYWSCLERGLKKRVSKDLVQLFIKILRAAIVVLGSVTALGTIGVDVTGLVASLGLGSFALAFALQDSLSNILSGVMILMYRPFVVGDVIKVLAFSGQVIDIDLRYTYIQTESEIAMIPNKTLFASPVSKIAAKKSKK